MDKLEKAKKEIKLGALIVIISSIAMLCLITLVLGFYWFVILVLLIITGFGSYVHRLIKLNTLTIGKLNLIFAFSIVSLSFFLIFLLLVLFITMFAYDDPNMSTQAHNTISMSLNCTYIFIITMITSCILIIKGSNVAMKVMHIEDLKITLY